MEVSMLESTVTRKGQVTIPKAIRDRLGVKEGEKVFFVMRGEEVILKVVKGTILDLRGSVQPSANPEDFEKVRRSVKQTVAKRVAAHG
ncbi:MAG: AbrB/MazE/SpoVT family DNA-binding domain-containing protein [Nitrospira sp. CG24E]|nr:MAG: AbrB/MazE/SpoVT family DNA-binding domain-containing protein [Nitrospira sp. CG24E]